MSKNLPVFMALSVLILVPIPAISADGGDSEPLVLSKMALMYVGGREIPMQGGGRLS